MKIDFKGVTGEELAFKINRIRINTDGKLDIKPQFSRQVRKVNGNDKLNFIALSVKIENTEAEPKPFDIHVTMVGVFEVDGIKDDAEERSFVIEATKTVYPYLRQAVSSLTSVAGIAPLYLPVIGGTLFPEDRDSYGFTISGGGNLN